MPELYEFEITGRMGPLIRSCLPELTPAAADQATVLTGTAQSPEHLHRVLDLLDTHGLPPPGHQAQLPRRRHRTAGAIGATIL